MSSLKLKIAEKNDAKTVFEISQSVIRAEYPKYYPYGAVEMFSSLHSLENIEKSIDYDRVFLILDDENAVGTVTVEKNHISRFFVLSEYQGRGIGTLVMDEIEELILKEFNKIELDASFPAQSLYLRRGYFSTEYIKHKCDNGDYLCYNIMCKSK